jgi:hypothetical protein
MARTAVAEGTVASAVLDRIVAEGYGGPAWYGTELKGSIADISAASAYKRPGKGRHNAAEIAMHHAWTVRQATAKLAGAESTKAFPLEGSDWFPLGSEKDLAWSAVKNTLAEEQRRFADIVGKIQSGALETSLTEAEQAELVLGVTCHAAYHAGQIQLVKVLNESK